MGYEPLDVPLRAGGSSGVPTDTPWPAPERAQPDLLETLKRNGGGRFREAVWPIYGETPSGAAMAIGSCVLVRWHGTHFLLTAAHITDNRSATHLYIGGAPLVHLHGEIIYSVEVSGRRDTDPYDFAAPDILDKLAEGVQFVDETQFTQHSETVGRLYTVVGFPLSKNKRMDRPERRVHATRYSFSNIGLAYDASLGLPNGGADHILLGYGKFSVNEEGRRTHSVAPRGMSGGGVIDSGHLGDPAVQAGRLVPVPSLAGIMIERRKEPHILVCTRIGTILTRVLR